GHARLGLCARFDRVLTGPNRHRFEGGPMTGAFSTLGSPIGYAQTGWGTAPFATQGIGTSPWQPQVPPQLHFVPQQLQQLPNLQLQQLQGLQQLQQLLQIVPQQLHQLQHVIQIVPQQLQQLQQQLHSQQSPFGQAAGIVGGFGTPFFGTPLYGPQSFPSQVM